MSTILIIDDGGYAATVAKKHLSPEQFAQMRFVEQTSRGVKKVNAIRSEGSIPSPSLLPTITA